MDHTDIRRAIESKAITLEEGLAFDNWVFENQDSVNDVKVPDELMPVIQRIFRNGAH